MMLALSSLVCVQFSPFEVELPDEARDQVQKNRDKLAARAPASPEHPLTIAFLADTHDAYSYWNRIVDYLNGRVDVELVVHTGDLTNHGTAIEYRWAWEAFSRLRAPFFAAPGNHDGLANGPDLWSRMFGPDSYAVDWAGIHFVFLNLNPNEWSRGDPDWTFLTTEIARGDKTWIVTHHPPSSPPHLSEAQSLQLWRILQRGGVDAWLYGHLHDDFGESVAYGVHFVKARSALNGSFFLVTTDGTSLRLEACVIDACAPAHPVVAPGTEPPAPGVLR